ncbi:uncharacterized protein LTR77_004601 [Saxophila tyrrhenica]|uniref:Uncharacterized protein n=1 Tax=Saxophila tyrrhenica TaxID=1690608 RepID=A0AAV9PE00_9PEZI|nr:hypothetical protein LTR77_004601 [Saxophila tyrrhenica]
MAPKTTDTRRAYYAHAAAVFALAPLTIGVLATLNPKLGLSLLNFPLPGPTASPKDQATIYGLIRFFGIRDVVIGASSLCVWFFGGAREGERKGCRALGGMMLMGVALVGVDGLASREVIGGGEWNHWALAPVGVGLGAGLMGWV